MLKRADDRNDYLPLPLGQVYMTPGAMNAVEETGMPPPLLIHGMLVMHAGGHWGKVDAEDAKANDDALMNRGRILSAYDLPVTGTRVWVITEWDRSVTTILLPSEY